MDMSNEMAVAKAAVEVITERAEIEWLHSSSQSVVKMTNAISMARRELAYNHPEFLRLLELDMYKEIDEIHCLGKGVAVAYRLPSQNQIRNAKATLKALRDLGLYDGEI